MAGVWALCFCDDCAGSRVPEAGEARACSGHPCPPLPLAGVLRSGSGWDTESLQGVWIQEVFGVTFIICHRCISFLRFFLNLF